MTHQVIDCLGVVLAGGLSSRMGQDKAQLKRLQKTTDPSAKSAHSMLDFSKQLLADAGIKNIVISGDNHQIPDRVPHAGPVGGIYSVLSHYLANSPEHLQPKALLILPVDLPLMTASALTELRLKGELSHKATFFSDRQKNRHHIPLYLPNNAFLNMFLMQAFHREELLANSKGNNKKNGPSVRAMLEQVPHQAIASLNNQVLFNTNTPEQWQQAQQKF
ncbi:molybdenum cofactor guanylyltransferase [Colwellia psychrerythraea]|uniref:Putative molybdopterin biosynthesis protein n=1 Tax=Colwellia psychrerythraea (strain 34H / ATCC BAA-681) TaxID=167879 RepID=Q47V91_COLP3|nr:molybdenum cofactor guanylyltransferase [Colwellia psychrerythraea]AAZ26025.1 putative molybdopterin biosynthesis gene [Colwellia psychrerythraea 34H]